MKLLGSSIYVTSTFYDFDGSLFSTLDSLLLCLYLNPENLILQDGIFHKKKGENSGKLRIDKWD